MRTSTALYLILLVVLLAAGAYVLWSFGETEQAPAQPTFVQAGNLTKGSPGADPDWWYLIYEEPGAPALMVRLGLGEACSDRGETLMCGSTTFEVGDRAEVRGEQEGDTVQVQSIELLGNI